MCWRYLSLLLGFTVLAAASAGRADTFSISPPEDGSALYLDCARFYEPDSGKFRLEAYYQFFTRALRFEAADGAYQAGYEANLRVRNERGRQVGVHTRNRDVTAPSEAQVRARDDFRVNQGTFYLDEGKYQVELTVRDVNSGQMASLDTDVRLKRDDFVNAKPRLSDIEFVLASSPVGEAATPFDKGRFTLVPSLRRLYGDKIAERLKYYLEAYPGSEVGEGIYMETVVRHVNGRETHRDTASLEFNGAVVRQYREIRLDQMGPGDYQLDVALKDGKGDRLHSVRERFRVAFTESALVRWDPGASLDLLSYIALPGDLKEVEAAETFDDRMAAIARFWKQHDPTPGTVENEIRSEFYRRVRVADDAFAHMRQPGWRTDRGIVFVKHGEPDELDDHPFNIDRHPYQVWHYYRGGRYLQFVFVDENEDGDYRLSYPFNGLFMTPDF